MIGYSHLQRNVIQRPDMHAHITAYKGQLIFELKTLFSVEDEVATSVDNPGNFGQVIMNTSINLGVSREAIDLLRSIAVENDDLGDVDWFSSVKGDAFSWIGGPFQIKDPKKCMGAETFAIRSHITIPNDPPTGAIKYIDSSGSPAAIVQG